MKCIVLEDGIQDKQLLEEYCSKVSFINLVASFENAESAIQYLVDHKVDLIISDVEMPGLNGFQFLEVITEKPLIIFQTTHPSFAVEGFNVNAIDFLVKPYSFERFYKAANKAYSIYKKYTSSNEEEYFYIKNRESLVRIDKKNISFVEAEENYCHINMLNDEKHIAIISLKKVEEQLGSGFARISRSTLANMDYCIKINPDSVQLKSGIVLQLGPSFRKGLEDAFLKHRIWQR
jgi:DNA-binding LytR/AlgR family response regulator